MLCAVLCLVTQSCLTLWDLMDCSLPGSSVHGDSSGKNTGVGLPCPPPGDLPNPGIKPRSLALLTDSLLSEPPGKPWNLLIFVYISLPPSFPSFFLSPFFPALLPLYKTRRHWNQFMSICETHKNSIYKKQRWQRKMKQGRGSLGRKKILVI